MRKDIDIPVVKDVYIAAVLEFNQDFNTNDWNAYIINDGTRPLESVLIVSQGFDDKDLTAPMRHSLALLPAKAYAKIEFLEDSEAIDKRIIERLFNQPKENPFRFRKGFLIYVKL